MLSVLKAISIYWYRLEEIILLVNQLVCPSNYSLLLICIIIILLFHVDYKSVCYQFSSEEGSCPYHLLSLLVFCRGTFVTHIKTFID